MTIYTKGTSTISIGQIPPLPPGASVWETFPAQAAVCPAQAVVCLAHKPESGSPLRQGEYSHTVAAQAETQMQTAEAGIMGNSILLI